MTTPARPSLRPLEAAQPPPDLRPAIREIVASSGGVPRRRLGEAVRAWAEIRHPTLPLPGPDQIARDLGLLIAMGEVDEQSGWVMPVAHEERRAG